MWNQGALEEVCGCEKVDDLMRPSAKQMTKL